MQWVLVLAYGHLSFWTHSHDVGFWSLHFLAVEWSFAYGYCDFGCVCDFHVFKWFLLIHIRTSLQTAISKSFDPFNGVYLTGNCLAQSMYLLIKKDIFLTKYITVNQIKESLYPVILFFISSAVFLTLFSTCLPVISILKLLGFSASSENSFQTSDL